MKIQKVNANEFKKISTLEHAYILGLLWADGTVIFANNEAKTPQIKHSTKKEDNVDFRRIFLLTGEWGIYETINQGSYTKKNNILEVNWTSNRELGEFLIENDYRNKIYSPNKILSKLTPIEKELWFRGFFDGDGSVTIIPKGHHSIAFSGSKHQNWDFVKTLFNDIGIERYKERILESRNAFSSQMRISNKKDINTFYDYLYCNSIEIGLKRKYEKFKLL
jgi:hypothetical protein